MTTYLIYNGYIHDIYLFKRAYFVVIVGSGAVTIDTCLVVNRLDVHYILVPDNKCDQKFKGTDHFVFIRLVQTCYTETVAHPSGRDEDDRWRLEIQSTDNTRARMTVVIEYRTWYVLKIILKHAHTYLAMYNFSPSGQ